MTTRLDDESLPAPSLYGEHELRPREGPSPAGAPRLVAELSAAASAAEREALVRGMLRGIGFEWLAYGTVMQQADGSSLPRSFLTTYAHPAWMQRYFSERYHEIDPRHLQAPRSSLPLVWDLDDIAVHAARREATGRARRFAEDFRDSGIRSGVFFHLASPQAPGERTVISLLADTPGRSWIVDHVLGQALTLGLCLHEFVSRHVRPPATPAGAVRAALSALQQDILHCLSNGQSDKEIAHRLQLSSHAVDYHMRQLRRRFAVRNRVQLINAAG